MNIFRPTADNKPTDFLNPLGEDRNEAKGEIRGEASFVEQTRQQFEKIKQNETQQARFQSKGINRNNLQVVNFELSAFSTGSAAFVYENFNDTVAVGSPLDEGVVFSSPTSTSNENALFYNIVYMNLRLNNSQRSDFLFQPSYIEFYTMQKINNTSVLGGKIQRQISMQRVQSNTVITDTGNEHGVQSFGLDVYNQQTLYNQSEALKGIRTIGLALKTINLNLDSSIDTANLIINVEIGLDLSSSGQNY